MGLNDEHEKARQAIEWLITGSMSSREVAQEYVLALADEVQRLRVEVQCLREDLESRRWHG